MLSPRARFVDESAFPLVSTKADLDAGRYRFRLNGGTAPSIARNDYLITGDTAAVVRLVLQSSVAHGVLTLETGPAYWSNVLRSGTYGVRLPLMPASRAPENADGQTFAVGPVAETMPAEEVVFPPRTDLCRLIDSMLASVPGGFVGPLCGVDQKVSQSVGNVTLTVNGTIDSMLIEGGHIAVNGGVDLAMTLDAGSVSGGRPPTFYPCNLAADPGCISTPTGAALIDFLRRYAPAIPDSSLPPIRVCIPKAPIRIHRAYWTWSGITPHYHAAVYTPCTITDVGALPTVVLPKLDSATAHIYPHIQGSLTFKGTANGTINVEFPVPNMARDTVDTVTDADGIGLVTADTAGFYIDAAFTLAKSSGVIYATFNDSGVVSQTWTASSGWKGSYQRVVSDRNVQFTSVPPDSFVMVLTPELKARTKLCLLACAIDTTTTGPSGANHLLRQLKIIQEVGVEMNRPSAGTWSREAIDPADSAIVDWKTRSETWYTFPLSARLRLPGPNFFLVPGVPTLWQGSLTVDSVLQEDDWGKGDLLVKTTTTGRTVKHSYVVTVKRADTLPDIIAHGATPVALFGRRGDWGSPLHMTVDPIGSTLFADDHTPCEVMYSDNHFSNFPIAGAVVQGLRSLGVGIPNFASPTGCDLLVARYKVTLGNVPQNCTVDSGAVRDSVWLDSKAQVLNGAADTTKLAFNVTCNGTAPTGDLVLTTTASTPPDSAQADYFLTVGTDPWGAVGPDTTVTVNGLLAGNQTLHFSGGPGNCQQLDSLVATVVAGSTDSVTAAPVCALPDATPPKGQVAVAATTTGGGGDPGGYLVDLDGVTRASMLDNAAGRVDSVPPSVPSVIQVAAIDGNCRATKPNPFVVTLDTADDPITVAFPVTCTASAIDTVSGTVESVNLPVSLVGLRTDGGSVLALSGGPTAELAPLAGMHVTVWGVKRGLALHLYGYALTSTVDTLRWVGIVEPRGSALWLFGTGAYQLLNAPPALAAAAGAYVWVTGTQRDSTITPSVFGIIRKAP